MVTYQASISTYTYSPDDSASCSFNEVPFSEELDIHPPLQLGDQAGVAAPSDVISADQLGHLSASVEDSITGAQAGNADHTVSVDESHEGETSPMDQAYPDTLTSDPSDFPVGEIEDLWEEGVIRLESLKVAADFIKGVRNATLDDSSLGLSQDAID